MFKWLKNKTKKTNVVFDLSKDNTTQIIWSDEKYISQELARSFSSVTPKDERDKIIQNTLKHAHQNSKFVTFSKFTMEDIITFLKNIGFEDFTQNSKLLKHQLDTSSMKEETMILKKKISTEYYVLIHLGFDHNGYQTLGKQTIQNTIYI